MVEMKCFILAKLSKVLFKGHYSVGKSLSFIWSILRFIQFGLQKFLKNAQFRKIFFQMECLYVKISIKSRSVITKFRVATKIYACFFINEINHNKIVFLSPLSIFFIFISFF
jgi:hypothetical protein